MVVAELMTCDVVTVGAGTSLANAAALLAVRRIRHLPVVRDGRLVGMITDRDLKRVMPSLVSQGGKREYDAVMQTTTVERIMSREPAAVSPLCDAADALRLIVQNRYGALPVVEAGEVVGIVSERDFLCLLLDHLSDGRERCDVCHSDA